MDILNEFKKIRVYQEGGVFSLHKPVMLLIALSRCRLGERRLCLFSEFDEKFCEFFRKFSLDGKSENSHYPFGKLENDGIWQVENSEILKRTGAGHLFKIELLEKSISGGFSPYIYKRLADDKLLVNEIIMYLLNTYFSVNDESNIYTFLSINRMENDKSIKVLTSKENQGGEIEIKNNGYITYLNSLHNLKASGANALAESQILNKYFPELYEPFPLAESLYQTLSNEKERVIFLTGHAGDGKSTVAMDVLKRLNNWPLDKPLEKVLKEKEEVSHSDGKRTYIVKDMSELSSDRRMDWLEQAFTKTGNWLIVSNTGPLIDSILKYAQQCGIDQGLDNEILKVLDAPYEGGELSTHTLTNFPKELVILNMTRLDNIDLASHVLNKMIKHPAWEECSGCLAERSCSLKSNQTALLAMGEDLGDRVRWIYKRVAAYEQRLTLRQMVAHLALSITGGVDCSTVCGNYLDSYQSEEEVGKLLSPNVFSENFFGYREGESWKEAENLLAIRLIKRMGFGGPIAVNFERQLLTTGKWSEAEIPLNLVGIQKYWLKWGQGMEGVRWRFALRRMLYFFSQSTIAIEESPNLTIFFNSFLKSSMLRQFDSWQNKEELLLSSHEKRELRKSCMQTLLEVYSGFCIGQFQEGQMDNLYLTLRRADQSVIQTTQIVIAKLSNDDFKLDYDAVKRLPVLLYRYADKIAKLELTLPLLDYIHDRAIGNLGNELAPIHLSQLDWFKAELLKLSQQRYSNEEVGLLRSGIDGEVKLHRYMVNGKELEID